MVGIHITATRAAFDGHVAHRHALFHGHVVNDIAAEFVGVAHAAIHAKVMNVRERHVLSVYAGLKAAGEIDAANLELSHRERLCGERVCNLTRADAEGQRAKRPVRGGVRIAACNRHSRLREPAFGADHMHDALLTFFRREKVDTVIGGVLLDMLEHLFSQWILQRPLPAGAGSGDNVIDCGKCALGKGHRKPLLADHRKRLRRGDLMDEMQPNEELILPRRQLPHTMPIENLMI